MHIERPEMDATLAALIEFHRTSSAARTEPDLVRTVARHVGDMTDLRVCVGIETRGLERGAYRVRDIIRIDASSRDAGGFVRENRWRSPAEDLRVQRSAVVSEILADDDIVIARDVAPGDDALLDEVFGVHADCIALPVYVGGAVEEWLLLMRPPGRPFEGPIVRALFSSLNSVSRCADQLQLLAEIEALHERLARQVEEIARVQRSILPARLPELPGISMAVSYEPSFLAGGDYYDFCAFDDGRLGIVIADVAGHGPAAAVVMAMLRTMMSIFRLLHHPAERVVDDLNAMLCDGLRDGTFVTAFFLALDPATGEIAFANAGHPPPRLRRADGRVGDLPGDATIPLGIMDAIRAAGGARRLAPGEAVVLFTDGITEAFDPAGRQFGLERLDAAIAAAEADPAATLDAVRTAVRRHAEGRAADDDRCILVVRYDGPSAPAGPGR